jgi:hypothetical protein
MAPSRQVQNVPATSAFMPSSAISARRAGHIAYMPPIMIPTLPRLAKPQSA